MSNDLVVGSIRSTTNPPLAGGIYEALLEKAQRERDEVRVSLDRLATIASEAFGPFPIQSAEENLTAIESGIHGLRMDNDKLERERDEAREESLEQARLLGKGGEREARLITERDEALEDAKRATYDAAQETIKVSTVKSHWIEACRERDHYKQALEEISTTIQEYKDSMVQEPAEDFIHAIKAWADKKLNNL